MIAVERCELPPVQAPGPIEFYDSDVYAVITSDSGITAEVRRMAYWDPRDGRDTVLVEFEVLVDGLPDAGGTASGRFPHSEMLCDMSAVSTHAAVLLAEVQQTEERNR